MPTSARLRPAAEDAAEGVRVYDKGEFEQAFALFSRAADAENAEAHAWLGALYANGEGTTASLASSFQHYRKAVEQDNLQAQTNVGAMLIMGRGVKADPEAGAAWLTRAAGAGDAYAQFNLATLWAFFPGSRRARRRRPRSAGAPASPRYG